MREPDWTRLPFATDRDAWRAYTEQATAAEVLALLSRGPEPACPVVWLEYAAIEAFAAAAGVEPARAWVELGAGVLRFWRGGCGPEDGQGGGVTFRGAPGLELTLGRLGDHLLLHLPR